MNIQHLETSMYKKKFGLEKVNEFHKIMNENPYFQYFSNTNMKDIELNIRLDAIPSWEDDPDYLSQFKKSGFDPFNGKMEIQPFSRIPKLYMASLLRRL